MSDDVVSPPRRPLRRLVHGGAESIEYLRDEMDRVFNQYIRPQTLGRIARMREAMGLISPELDMVESESAVTVMLDLPGVDEGDISVAVGDGTLTIKGERKAVHEETEDTFHRIERSFGAFQRTIALPCEVVASKAEATLGKGVLRITLPKSAQAKSRERKIVVHSA